MAKVSSHGSFRLVSSFTTDRHSRPDTSPARLPHRWHSTITLESGQTFCQPRYLVGILNVRWYCQPCLPAPPAVPRLPASPVTPAVPRYSRESGNPEGSADTGFSAVRRHCFPSLPCLPASPVTPAIARLPALPAIPPVPLPSGITRRSPSFPRKRESSGSSYFHVNIIRMLSQKSPPP